MLDVRKRRDEMKTEEQLFRVLLRAIEAAEGMQTNLVV